MANNTKEICRICCVCRVLQPINNMKRIVRVGTNFIVQKDKRLNGRGAHVCPKCLNHPNLNKSLCRSFKTQVPAEILNDLQSNCGKV